MSISNAFHFKFSQHTNWATCLPPDKADKAKTKTKTESGEERSQSCGKLNDKSIKSSSWFRDLCGVNVMDTSRLSTCSQLCEARGAATAAGRGGTTLGLESSAKGQSDSSFSLGAGNVWIGWVNCLFSLVQLLAWLCLMNDGRTINQLTGRLV